MKEAKWFILVWCLFFIPSKDLTAGTLGKKKNIVFIFSDDLSFRDLSCYGQTNYKTPNIDALAAISTRFTQAYTPAPECAPSRGCMLTGKHLGNSSIRNNTSDRGFEYLPDSDITFAEILKKAGYNTGVIGKWGVGNKNTPGSPTRQGFDYHFGYLSHYEAHSYFPWKMYENEKDIEYPGNKGFDMSFLYPKEDDPKAFDYEGMYDVNGNLLVPNPTARTYASDVFDDKSLAFLDQQNRQTPFLLYFTTNLPHGPAIVDNLRQLTGRKDMNVLSREWGAMVQRLDESVGKLINKLKEKGLYEETIIVFASDNGYAMHNTKKDAEGNVTWPDDEGLQNKGPFDGGKFSVREGGMRIPFFVHYPGQTSSRIVSEPVWLVDILPTFAAIARQPIPAQVDGVSLLPILANHKRAKPLGERVFYFFKLNEQSVRKGAWFGVRANTNQPLRLYLLEEDQACQRDLAAYYPAKVKELETILNTIHQKHPWYWNPGETQEIYQAKRKKATDEGLLIDEYRPNGMLKMPWEK